MAVREECGRRKEGRRRGGEREEGEVGSEREECERKGRGREGDEERWGARERNVGGRKEGRGIHCICIYIGRGGGR